MNQNNNPDTSGQGFSGQAGLQSGLSDYNAIEFVFRQLLGTCRTAVLVQVQSCTVAGNVGPIGLLDAIPSVNMIDGLGTATQHHAIHNLAYARPQAGYNAIIMDPQPGDIGLAVVCDRDISSVKNTAAQANPGSRRRFDLADGVYLFTVVSKKTPTQYVRFVQDGDGNPNGIEVVDALGNSVKTSPDGINWLDKFSNTIVSDANGVTINGVKFDRSQKITNISEATSQSGVTLTQHHHTQGADSHGDAEQPTNPPTG